MLNYTFVSCMLTKSFMAPLRVGAQIRLAALRAHGQIWWRESWDRSRGGRQGLARSVAAQWFLRMTHMLDLVFVIIGAALFLGSLIYARLCANI
jgi:hypothetical protein